MHKDGVEEVLEVLWAAALLALDEGAEIQQLRELAPVVELDGGVCDWIVLEPHQMEVEDGRELLKDDSFLCVLKELTCGW